MRKALAIGTVASALLGVTLTSTPAHAADTLVTFTAGIGVESLTILPGAYVPGVPGTNVVNGTIATVITDTRLAAGTWTATISSTDFALVGASPATGTALVPATSAKVWSAATVTVPGTATITNTHTSLATALSLANTGATLVSATTANANITTLAESLQIDVTGKAAGVYTGTVTQTAS